MEYLVAIVVVALISAVIVVLRKGVRRAVDEAPDAMEGAPNRDSVDVAESGGDADGESVDMSEEESNRQAEQVQRIHVLCQLAESHLDDLTDDYEQSMLSERIRKAESMAEEIQDPFYYGAAIHPIVSLAYRAGWENMARELLESVSDSFTKEKIVEDVFHEDT